MVTRLRAAGARKLVAASRPSAGQGKETVFSVAVAADEGPQAGTAARLQAAQVAVVDLAELGGAAPFRPRRAQPAQVPHPAADEVTGVAEATGEERHKQLQQRQQCGDGQQPYERAE